MGCFRIGYRHLVRFGLGRGSWPIRIGCLNPKSQLPRLSMMTMQSLNNEDFYFICLEILCSGMAKTWQQGILLCVREGAGTYYHGFVAGRRSCFANSLHCTSLHLLRNSQ
ncbi:hypothetical protein CsSME_00052271 [Camellia sinensis var. sinensis]